VLVPFCGNLKKHEDIISHIGPIVLLT
jgi:hypothetical protein